jgi:hypothetical protein
MKVIPVQDSNTEIALLYYVALEEGSSATLTPEYDSSGILAQIFDVRLANSFLRLDSITAPVS